MKFPQSITQLFSTKKEKSEPPQDKPNKDKSKKDNSNEDELRTLFTRFIWGISLFTIVLIVIIYNAPTCSPSNSILTFLGIAAGCVALGCAIGFLFGIPRAQKNKPADAEASSNESKDTLVSSNGYNDNTNLEEISDWLTKIILGLTLVELMPILNHVDHAALNFSAALAGNCCKTCTENYYVFAYAIIGFYFLAGGGLSYLWTRSSLLSILEERRLKRMRKYTEELNLKNESLRNKLSKANKIVNKPLDQELNVKNEGLSDKLSEKGIHKPEDTLPPKTKELTKKDTNVEGTSNRNKFRTETMKIYKARKVKHPDDLQLGRWGGESEKDFRLSAIYNPSSVDSGFYEITLVVDPVADQDLGSQVAFFLHDTFPEEVEFVNVVNNRASFKILSFEAFAVGARTESGVELELNLNKVKGFPPDFYY